MPIRVMVVDDSVVVRRALTDALNTHDDITVIATAVDGQVALRKIAEFKPELVVLDIEMPVLDGLETLVAIRARWPHIAVIMFSTLTEHGANVALEALALGAVDYATKPTRLASRQAAHDHVNEHVLPLVLLWGARAAQRTVGRTKAVGIPSQSYRTTGYGARRAIPENSSGRTTPSDDSTAAVSTRVAPVVRAPASHDRPVELLVIGSSTGGPDALARLLPLLPGTLPVPIVIVQHMPPVFTAMLAKRLDTACTLHVSESVDDEVLQPGHVYIAAGGVHLEVRRDRHLLRGAHSDAPRENSCKPAVDVLFRTASAATKGRLRAVVLTGMGQDGLLGSRAVVQAGGTVLAQDEATSVVWGMPGYVARDGIASVVAPLEDLVDPMTHALSGATLTGATS